MLRHADVLEDPLTAALQPPLDETPEEKTKRLKREIRAKRVSDQIDGALRGERDDLRRRRAARPDVRLLLLGQAASGKSTLGFLNPWLYKVGYKAFTDITSGSAVGCAETGDDTGFPAQEGWDAVTGFGTPKFKSILELLGISNATFTGRRQGWSLSKDL